MFRTFFRNIPLRSFYSYGKFFHKSDIESLSDLEKASKIQSDQLPTEIVQKEKINNNEELLKQFPNKFSKEQMDELSTKLAIIRKYYSVY
jgi:hypothetical protein